MDILLWIGFLGLVAFLLFLDLGVFHKNSEVISTKEALKWTLIWIATALVFNVLIYFMYEHNWLSIATHFGEYDDGGTAALKFFTGYLIEKSLSLDNIFVIAMIFSYFKIEQKFQHRILFWGIVGALVLRGVMILVGVALLHQFAWITYFFGALLIYSAIKMLGHGNEHVEPDKNPVIRFVKKFYRVSTDYSHGNFFTVIDGKKAITTLFVVLLVVETTDVMFAVDSIPAIFAITTDPFIVFTSNVFAILGLRSLYFVLAAFMNKFRYIKLSLVIILAFVGVKMLLVHYYKIPALISLAVILLVLAGGVLASIYIKEPENETAA